MSVQVRKIQDIEFKFRQTTLTINKCKPNMFTYRKLRKKMIFIVDVSKTKWRE